MSYAINFTSGGAPTYFLQIGGDLGSNLAITGFVGSQASTCANESASTFKCELGQLGPGAPIQQITVNANVQNVADGTVIDLPLSAFWVKDGGADTPYNVPNDDAGELTVQNESLLVNVTDTADPITAGTNTTYTVSVGNSGSGASGAYGMTLTLTGGKVTNVICPGPRSGAGQGSTTATCTNNASIAPSDSTSMIVDAKSDASASNTTMTATVAFSPSIQLADGSTTSQSTAVTGVTPTAAKLAFTKQPSGGSAGAAFATQPIVAIQDAGGATVTTDNSTQVTLSAGGGPGALTCDDNTKTAVNGTAIFTGCRINQPGTYTLHAASAPLAPADSSQVVVTASDNPRPTLDDVDPKAAIVGSPDLEITVTGEGFVAGSKVRWNKDELATNFESASTLHATVPAAKLASVGTADITVVNPTPGGGTSARQITFTVNTGATKLAFGTQPGGAEKDKAFGTQPLVIVQNANGETVTADSSTKVTLALVGGGTLSCSGGLEKTAAKGVVTFAGCKVDTAGSGYSIVASAPSLTSATSEVFDVTGPSQKSAEVVVAAPAKGVNVPRSRLAFSATTGKLSPAPISVAFVIKRKSDSQYWNGEAGSWQKAVFENQGVAPASAGGAWTYAITGEARREFANTTVTVEARAASGASTFSSAAVPEIAIR